MPPPAPVSPPAAPAALPASPSGSDRSSSSSSASASASASLSSSSSSSSAVAPTPAAAVSQGRVEIAAAVDFVGRHINSPHSQVSSVQSKVFVETLSTLLSALVASSTWIPAAPHHGSARRCLLNTSKRLDKTLLKAAVANSIPPALVLAALPADLVLWVDPGSVCYRAGSDHSPVVVVWEDPAAAQQRLAMQQQHLALKWSHDRLSGSPPQLGGYMSPPTPLGFSGNNSPQLTTQQFGLPQKTKVVMKMPTSKASTSSFATAVVN